MRWLVDAQLPPALARWLSSQGQAAEHVADVGFLQASDERIWTYAGHNHVTLITKDEDFPTLLRLRPNGAAVVWVRLGNTTRAQLLGAFERALPEILRALEQGERLIELV